LATTNDAAIKNTKITNTEFSKALHLQLLKEILKLLKKQ